MVRSLLLLLTLPLAGCATVGGIRNAPLDAGAGRVFPQPLPVVVAAAQTALDSVHLTLDATLAPDPRTAMIVAHHGMDLLSYGEVVRILMRTQPDGWTLVHVYTRGR